MIVDVSLFETAVDPLWNIVNHGGALGVLAVVLWSIVTGRLVPARYYEAALKDANEWKQIARAGTSIVDKAVEKVPGP